MTDLQPRPRKKGEVEPRHIPEVVVPVAIDEVRALVRDALRGTSIANPVSSAMAGFMFFEPHLRFTPVDAAHTRIELDLAGTSAGAEALLFVQRRAEIHRFFVAIEDELDRRERWRPHLPPSSSGEAGPASTL